MRLHRPFTLPLGRPGYRFSQAVILMAACIFAAQAHAQTSKGTGHWTLYHIAELPKEEPKGAYQAGQVTLLGGKKVPYRVSSSENRKIEMEGTVMAYEPESGKVTVFARLKKGLWKELGPTYFGWGNRTNPKYPFRIVAADQSVHRFGSRVYRPDLVGYVTPDGMVHDGYFWVGDTGGRIKGTRRFDLFVGGEKAFAKAMKDGLGTQEHYCEVERLPTAPSGYDPKTQNGVKKILTELEYDLKESSDAFRGQKVRNYGELTVEAALEDFQKAHPQIPKVEYGSSRGAVTLWFLTQAALAVSQGEKYAVGG